MDEDILYGLAAVLAVLFGGMTVFVPVLGFTIRTALRPMLETWAEVRRGQGSGADHATLARQVESLQAEVRLLRENLRSVEDTQEFQRQLTTPRPEAPLDS
jgi:hypothetical protein